MHIIPAEGEELPQKAKGHARLDQLGLDSRAQRPLLKGSECRPD